MWVWARWWRPGALSAFRPEWVLGLRPLPWRSAGVLFRCPAGSFRPGSGTACVFGPDGPNGGSPCQYAMLPRAAMTMMTATASLGRSPFAPSVALGGSFLSSQQCCFPIFGRGASIRHEGRSSVFLLFWELPPSKRRFYGTSFSCGSAVPGRGVSWRRSRCRLLPVVCTGTSGRL